MENTNNIKDDIIYKTNYYSSMNNQRNLRSCSITEVKLYINSILQVILKVLQ
jgi:hypothetical protein